MERDILEDLYKKTGGAHWIIIHNWLSANPIESWFGLKTNDEGEMTEMDLRDNNLDGSNATAKHK